MPSSLRFLFRNLSTLLLAFVLALAVWISAVTAADPTQESVYPQAIPIEVVGQDPAYIQTAEVPSQVSLTLSAPQSIWERLINEQIPVRAVADLSGLGPGEHSVDVQVQIDVRPVEVVSQSPQTITVNLEQISSADFPIRLIQQGTLAIGYQAGTPTLDPTQVTLTGPDTLLSQVKEVRAVFDVSQISESVTRTVPLQAVDENELPVNGLTIVPERVNIHMDVSQRGGYRNVVVKVVLQDGQIQAGYRVTNISVSPPWVTVFSANPDLVDQLPGFIETAPLDLAGATDNLDVFLPLNLPQDITVVGEQTTVEVQVEISPIEGSITLADMPVEIAGMSPGYSARISPETVSVIIAGPLPLLDQLTKQDVRVVVDVAGTGVGIYQRVPRVEFSVPELGVESVLPNSIEVTISRGTATPAVPTPTPGPNVTPSPTG
ncbi:MAG: hypothetical protein GYA17_06745 [Chloroflexi bacterium]|nr:CdaR family protein [Anaerolineaceae bacterium]NMB88039.1 hypothetical protein [Chloroflexota bacterium]